MRTHVIDFETYWDKDVSLSKLPTLHYVRHPLFKVHGAAIKVERTPAFWVSGKDLPAYFDSLDWDDVLAISHNALFDMAVLYEKYGKRPAQRVDTLGLARALLPTDMDFDVDSLGKVLGIGGKTDDGRVIQKIKGIRDLSPELEAELAPYAINDAEKEYHFFELLYPHLPEIERRLLDLTIRMGTEGILLFNHETAKEALKEANDKRDARIANSGLDLKVLRSSEKFANELRARGVEPPKKISARTGKETYAFSKSDRKFLDLLDHPDVAHLCDGRLAAMSAGDINRITRLLDITGLAPHTIPMPLNYCAAHTYRWGGTGGINVQNLRNGTKLRESFEAPEGHNVNVADSSQIELRLNMWFCGQLDILEMLRNDEDVYSYMASRILKEHVDKSMKPKRQFGKVVELGCGYQMGPPKFRATCAIGPMGNPPIFLTREEAENAVYGYRDAHPFVVATWNWLGNFAIPHMADKDCHIERGPIVFKHERIELPNGLALLYPNLRFHVNEETGESGWIYGINGVVHKLYGGKLLENIIQALARIVVAEQMDRIDREIEHIRVVSMTHDEVIAVSPEAHSAEVQEQMFVIMSTPPSWAPDLPVKAEGGYARNYSK